MGEAFFQPRGRPMVERERSCKGVDLLRAGLSGWLAYRKKSKLPRSQLPAVFHSGAVAPDNALRITAGTLLLDRA
jgi:hypothetical protein